MIRKWQEHLNADQKKRLRAWERRLEKHDEKAKEARREIDKLYRISLVNKRRKGAE
jgi:hypothetical protein